LLFETTVVSLNHNTQQMKQYADIKDRVCSNGYSTLKECLNSIDDAMGFGRTSEKAMRLMDYALDNGINIFAAALSDGALYIEKEANHFYPVFRQNHL